MTTPEAGAGLRAALERIDALTISNHGSEAIVSAVGDIARAALTESPLALDVERLAVALKRHNCNGDPTPRACAEAIAREYAATPPTDEEKSVNDDAKAMAQAMADAHDLGRAEALDGAQERIAAILFGAVDDERFAAVMAALAATPPTDETPPALDVERPRTSHRACMADLRCCRNDGHDGDHLYPTEYAATPPTDETP